MLIFKNGKVVLQDYVRTNADVAVENGKIITIGDITPDTGAEIIDCDGKYVAPGYVDIHVHGGGGGDFMDANAADLEAALLTHTAHGTTTIFPTTLAGSMEETLCAIRFLVELAKSPPFACHIAGIHLEGPYFNPSQRGAQDINYLKTPEKEHYTTLLCTDFIKRVSYAPELDGGLLFAQNLRQRGILGAVAHTDAHFDIVKKAFDLGTTHVTHLYSGMQGVHRIGAYRHVGVVESAYLLDDMTVEIIADGKHLPAELLKLIYKIKGPDKIALVTDAMRGAGQTEGESTLGSKDKGQVVYIRDGVAFMPDGSCFAGSVATMDILVRNMVRLAEVPLCEAVKMASLTPASIMGIAAQKGSLQPGKDADILVLDEKLQVEQVYISGRKFTG